MDKFFTKYGQGQNEPYHAIEMMLDKLFHVKEKVEKGDSNIAKEMGVLSDMIDDFMQFSKGMEFKPRQFKGAEYQDYQGKMQGGVSSHYDPYRVNGRIGYKTDDYYYPQYPIYPFFKRTSNEYDDRDGERDSQDNRDYTQPRRRQY